ncbi:MAG: DUF6214 family protein [Pseudonocardiaceae bacterium]
MSWPGRVTIRGHEGGRNGAPVILGRTLVPPVATFEIQGDNGAPDATVRFEVRDGRPECMEISVKANPTGRGIRSADMNLFNLDNLIENVFTELGAEIEQNPHNPAESIAAWRPVDESERARWARRGDVHVARANRRPTKEELERVASIYREHHGGAPLQAVAKLLSTSRRTAARRVAQAREAGLLPPSGAETSA